MDWAAEVEKRERLWQQVFDGPGEWLDYRAAKAEGHAAPGHPDFRRRSTGEAVWARSFFAPPWVAERLEAADESGSPSWTSVSKSDLKAEQWERLFREPEAWLDFRGKKASGQLKSTHPDFREDRQDGEALWVADPDTPESVPARLREADQGESLVWRSAGDAPWIELFEEPSKWRSFRAGKAAGEFAAAMPDFMHRLTGDMLWVDHMPRWAAAKLREVAQDSDSPWFEERREGS